MTISFRAKLSLMVSIVVLAAGVVWLPRLASGFEGLGPNGLEPNRIVSVNAASYSGSLAPGSIAAGFGVGLASGTVAAAALPLPTELGGVSVVVTDGGGREMVAPLFFVSPGQINYLVPEEAGLGAGRVRVMNRGVMVSEGEVSLTRAAPALFTATANGRGVPLGMTTFNGTQFESLVGDDGTPRPIGTGSVWQPNYLTLFGTGLRKAERLRVRIGGVEVEPLYAGAQGGYAGLDQINIMVPSNLSGGISDITIVAEATQSNVVQIRVRGEAAEQQGALTAAEVQTLIAQAVGQAQQAGLKVTVAVVDHEGNVLGVFRMTGAAEKTKIGIFSGPDGRKPEDSDGLQNLEVPAEFAAISKAGTAAFFSTQGNAFTTRTASFIVQEHFPPLIRQAAGGPLFGVQFSQLPCGDIKVPASLPLGLSADPGGVPVYKNGIAAGGIGIEGDGLYTVDLDGSDGDQAPEEIIAVAATRGFEAPAAIRGDQILADGIRLPFVNAGQTGGSAAAFASLPGVVDTRFPVRGAAASTFSPLTLGGVAGRVDSRFHPFRGSDSTASRKLTAAQVTQIITQAAQQAARTRAAIRQPLGSAAEVNIAVVDTDGRVLGLFSTADAPIFGFDVSVQKARTAAFFSSPTAGAQLRTADAGNFARYVVAAQNDGIALDGRIAFSDRAVGFMARPFLPDGIDGSTNGPFSKPISLWSPFNTGLQTALVARALRGILRGEPVTSCTGVQGLRNGIQIFAGSVPLYIEGTLVGAIGISGDGIDQDDIIADTGSTGFGAPPAIRSDRFFIRNVRLPYVKYPRHPNL